MFTSIYDTELVELEEFAKNFKKNPLTKSKLDPWDYSYYMREYEDEKYSINQEEIKKYFPIDTVRNGLFEIYQKLLGLVFEEVVTTNKWHEDVQLYQVLDKQTNEFMGYFYLDMYPRDGKFGHAAAFNFLTGCDMTKFGKNERRPNIITMACNFPKGECISFDDVVTFFHEFGHVMHFICGKPELTNFSSFNIEWDFVEAPSQMLEYWCYSSEPLKLMSKHVETGEPIPNDIVQKIKQSKNVFTGYFHKRQIMFGLFDLAAHTKTFNSVDDNFNSLQLWDEIEEQVMDKKASIQISRVASFGHLMSSYDAGYYGYLRSSTYAANMFYLWFKDGHTLDPKVGMRYRKKLLEPASTNDGIELLKDFLDEEPDDIYFLIDKGLEVNIPGN